MADYEWSEAAIARLRELWDAGHSAAEIGRRMRVSRNAIIGKAHRLRLTARPSPIRAEIHPGERRKRGICTPRKIVGSTLPPLPSPAPAPESVQQPTFFLPLSSGPCVFPIGQPRTPSFHYCDAPALAGKPYCATHCAIAYVRAPLKAEAA